MTEKISANEAGQSLTADPQTLFFAAVQLHRQGRFDEAENSYREVLGHLPGHPKILGNLAALYRDLRRFEEAIYCCRQALQEMPDDPLLHLNLGAVQEEQGDIEGAIASFRRVLALDAGNVKALNNLGKALHRGDRMSEGEGYIRQALGLQPDYPLALNNLGVICSEQGNHEEAVACFRRALHFEPDDVGMLYNLAGILNCQGGSDEAISLMEKVLKHEPDHASARHMLAALVGEVTDAAPRAYVEQTFDAYAVRFDRHLTERLGYTVPKVLQEMVGRLASPDATFACALDLGCGTGLTGEVFRPLSRELHGVDVSANMLARAGEKGVYDRLEREDIVTYLDSCRQRYELFIAADVFIYIGRLDRLFAGLGRCAAPGAFLAFSIERCGEGQDYCLRPSGRYAQSRGYIERLAGEHGWAMVSHRHHDIRLEEGHWIEGDLFVLQLKE